MEYKRAIEIVANSDRSEFERGEILIRGMCRLTEDILNYRYIVEHTSSGTVKEDKVRTIKNSMSIMLGDLDVYMKMLGIKKMIKNQ